MDSYIIIAVGVLIALVTIGLVIKFIKKTILRIIVIVIALAVYLSGGTFVNSLINAGEGAMGQVHEIVQHATR